MYRNRALELLRRERQKQVERKGYTNYHDEDHTLSDWVSIIAHELGDFSNIILNGGDLDDFKSALVKIGAVALAALEQIPGKEERMNQTLREHNERSKIEVLAGGRQSGKTTHLVYSCIINGDANLVVPSYDRKRHIVDKYNLNKEQADRIVVFSDYNRLRGRSGKVVVDDVERCLANVLGQKPKAISVTGDARKPSKPEWTNKEL